MPHLKTTHKEDATILFDLDPSFTGIMRGVANDESEGCSVIGNCIVQVHKPVKIRRFIVWLEGRCKVNIKGTGYSVSNTEGTESRTLYSKDIHFMGDDGLVHTLMPGQYAYPFRFDLPANLPASFRGKRGYIRYRLQAAIHRPNMFSSDIQASRDIPIKRCLLNDHTNMADLRETYEGKQHTNKLRYSATAPSIAYREGGLIRLNIEMQLQRPETQSIRTVTCALRERIQYRTTDSNANTVLSKTDNLFPLGYSTFYPSQAPDYDPKAKADYNALFRLCPRVSADLNSRLMKVTHALVVNIMLDDSQPDDQEEESAYETEATDTEWTAFSEDERHVDTKHSSPSSTPPGSTPGSPILSRSSSASSLVSIFAMGRSHSNGYTSGGEELATIPAIKSHRKKSSKKHKDSHGSHLTLCTLEVPLVVTSREHLWNEKPNPPAYDEAQEPPSYDTALDDLPRAPTYPTDDSGSANSSARSSQEEIRDHDHHEGSSSSSTRPSLVSRSSFMEARHAAAKVLSAVSSKVPRSHL
ncbi:Arrestin domain-containing protein 2 [Rhizopus azygosporus]|uniref:Arrestin domain-containing protein 2 n=1 Tax=Rhizopus azygosporus TaxID=86630 RepID=A0A367J1K6_RHIAZ|nr:Arrestin domain-containing protein 2 [Rhizopus azygosporus]